MLLIYSQVTKSLRFWKNTLIPMGQRIQGGRCETVCPCRNACLKGLGKSL